MLSVPEFARAVLYGETLEEKLVPAPDLAPEFARAGADRPGALPRDFEIPAFPGRPGPLGRVGKAEFPRSLAADSDRGRVLHFFANHELLAMELMALALLKFPGADPAFRASLVRTIQEEQAHLRLYLARMRELGVDFGDLPVSDYFWKAMRDMRSPLEFVTQMSLTLEQANLDFSLQYRDAVAQVGDAATAAILDQVYRDEIGHVKNGLAWFERWREPGPSLWDAYRRLLPPPMTPARAKGARFSEEGRRAAGLPEDFIRALRLDSSSKGRAPQLRWFEPDAERQIAHSLRAPSGFTSSATSERLALDLEGLLTFVSTRHDVAWVREIPSPEWREACAQAGFELPEYVLLPDDVRERKLAGLDPWAWSESAWRRARPLRDRLVPASGGNAPYCETLLAREAYPLAPVFSKLWPAEWTPRDPQGRRCTALDQIRGPWPLAAKAPYGASGTQVQRLDSPADLTGPRGGWIEGVVRDQGAIWIEPWVEILAELSLQFIVGPARLELLGVRHFETGPRREYRGAHLDPSLTSLGPEALAFLHAGPLALLRETALEAGRRLREAGYQGPAGIDAYLWRGPDGALRFQPLSELNPRYTMGRIALELERRVRPGGRARWRWAFRKEAGDLAAHARGLAAAQPLVLSSADRAPGGPPARIQSGVFFTNDPARAREVLTYLEVPA